MEDIIDLDNFEGNSRSVNFGGGLEFLMNDKKRNSSVKSQIDLDELNNLENELNDITDNNTENVNIPFKFGGGNNMDYEEKEQPSVFFESMENEQPRTWDGYGKVNMDSEFINNSKPSASEGLNANEKRRKKRAMLKKINEWCEKGIIKNNPNYTLDTPYEEIEDEYESCLEDKRKKDSVKMYGWWFMAGVNTIEYVNSAYNPFDLNLDGWGEQITDDLDSYDEIFAELYEKYKGGKMAPELSLILRLGCSAAMVNFTNKALSAATPGFNDIIRQSPELMKAFTNATVNTMSQQNPSVGFMNNIVNQEPTPNTSYGAPPKPVETQRNAHPQNRPVGNSQMFYTNTLNGRPDLAAATGKPNTPMFRENGVNINSPMSVPNNYTQERTQLRPEQNKRPEMNGPNISDNNLESMLSSLKTKSNEIIKPDEDSMISISSLKELQTNTTLPKSSRKRNSGKNSRSLDKTVSLDI